MANAGMDQDRLQRIRNFQSTDWYPALFIRPLSILVMLVIADWRFLTPNRLTTIANLGKLGACALILFTPVPDHLGPTIWAVVLLQVGIVFDHLDGTMARYRRAFTRLGSFYDKVSDLVTWFLIIVVAPPPARTRADWLRWFARSWLQIIRFEEMDLFFWVGLGLLVNRLEWLIWLLFATQTTILLSMVYRRTRDIIRVDRRLRDLGDA